MVGKLAASVGKMLEQKAENSMNLGSRDSQLEVARLLFIYLH